MKRRSFLKLLGIGAAVPAVAKAIPEKPAYYGTLHQESGYVDRGYVETFPYEPYGYSEKHADYVFETEDGLMVSGYTVAIGPNEVKKFIK